MPRSLPALLAVVAAGLVVTAALLPEFEAAGLPVTPLDPSRPAWVAILVGTLVHVGLLLVPMLMLFLSGRRDLAGGILVGAGVLGLSLRLVRLVQLGQTPELNPALGSYVDLLAEVAALSAGALALGAGKAPSVDEEVQPEPAPPPGDRPESASS